MFSIIILGLVLSILNLIGSHKVNLLDSSIVN